MKPIATAVRCLLPAALLALPACDRPALSSPTPVAPATVLPTGSPTSSPQPSAPSPQPPTSTPQFQAGITVPVWSVDGYTTAACDATWPQIAGLGATWVAIVPTWYQASAEASQIAPEATGRSASDGAVRHAIAAAHAAGLRVLLKPHVDSADNTWRGTFRPADPAGWFASYTAFITYWAVVGQGAGADEFAVGTELVALTGPAHTADWQQVVAAVRAVYHGPLTYAANWGKRGAEYERIEWWDRLDYIGIDAYFPLSGQPAPTVADLTAGWDHYTDPWGQTYDWRTAIAAVQARWQRPILFTEVGYASSAYGPASYDAPTPPPGPPPIVVPDLAVQANAYQALFAAWATVPWFAGFYAWQWSPDPAYGGPQDPSLFVNGKPPVLDVLRAGFGAVRR